MIIMMRTTVNIPDDAYEIAKSVAQVKGMSLGDALGDLVRQAVHPESRIDTSGDFPTFVVSSSAPPITLEQTLAAEDDD